MQVLIENLKKQQNLPLVTVAVPCYNHEKFVVQCIESIIAQTYKNIELVVVDDGSVDGSPDVLRNLSQQYNFKLILQKNQGLPRTINTILKHHTNGKYFSLCASDDYWLLDKIEKQVAFMEANQFYPMCYGKTHYVDEKSKNLKYLDNSNDRLKGGWLFDDIFLIKIHPPVNYMYRTEIFKEIGYFNEEIFAEDYYMNLKISSKYAIGFLNEYLGFYRLTNMDYKIERFGRVIDSHQMAMEEFKDNGLFKKAKTLCYLRKFENYAGYRKHKRESLINLFKSLPLFYQKRFFKACLKLCFFWK